MEKYSKKEDTSAKVTMLVGRQDKDESAGLPFLGLLSVHGFKWFGFLKFFLYMYY
jgi:hypothetical protein